MFEIKKQMNYKTFAETLRAATGCDVNIVVMSGREHYHYELNKGGIAIGVLCYNSGSIGFAPLTTSERATDREYIPVNLFPSLDDLAKAMMALQELFVEK